MSTYDVTNYRLTVKQAAEMLNVSVRTIRRWVKKGKLSSILVPGKKRQEIRLSEKEVLNLKGDREVTSPDIEVTKDDIVTNDVRTTEFKELLNRYENLVFQLGQLQSQVVHIKELEAEAQSLREREKLLEEENKRLREELEKAKRSWWQKLKSWWRKED